MRARITCCFFSCWYVLYMVELFRWWKLIKSWKKKAKRTSREIKASGMLSVSVTQIYWSTFHVFPHITKLPCATRAHSDHFCSFSTHSPKFQFHLFIHSLFQWEAKPFNLLGFVINCVAGLKQLQQQQQQQKMERDESKSWHFYSFHT